MRAWVVSKADSVLHLLIYCQHSDSNNYSSKDEARVELLSHGCDPAAAPSLVAAFGLSS